MAGAGQARGHRRPKPDGAGGSGDSDAITVAELTGEVRSLAATITTPADAREPVSGG